MLIILKSNDGGAIHVDHSVMAHSMHVTEQIRDHGYNVKKDEKMELNLDIKYKILVKIVEWCTQYKDHAVPPKAELRKRHKKWTVPEWDKKFLEIDTPSLFELTNACYMLKIHYLIENTCKTIADNIKGKSPGEIRAYLNLPGSSDDLPGPSTQGPRMHPMSNAAVSAVANAIAKAAQGLG